MGQLSRIHLSKIFLLSCPTHPQDTQFFPPKYKWLITKKTSLCVLLQNSETKDCCTKFSGVESCPLMILPSENQVHTALAFHLRTVLKDAFDLYILIKPFNLSVSYYRLYKIYLNSAISSAPKIKFASLNYTDFSCNIIENQKNQLHLVNNKQQDTIVTATSSQKGFWWRKKWHDKGNVTNNQ